MKNIAIIILLISGLSISDTSAQDYLFRVLANKGQNQVQKAGATSATSLKTGSKLYSGDQIIASKGAYIGLVYKSGKTFEIKSEGTYKLSDLEAKMAKKESSLTSRYVNFVMNKMNDSDEGLTRNYRRNLNATGAVERATKMSLSMLMMDATAPNKVLGDQVLVRWEGGEENDTYVVTIKDIFGDVIQEVASNDNKYVLDFTSDELKTYNLILVAVKSASSDNVESTEYGIQKLRPSETNLNTVLAELNEQLVEGSTLNDLVYASFYEQNSLYLDAMTKYEEVVTENPDIEDFKVMYDQFIGVDEADAGE